MSASVLSAGANQVFSTRALREVLAGKPEGQATRTLNRLVGRGLLKLEDEATNQDGLSALGSWLAANRRNEYVYKNLIANKILLGRHNLATATMLSEFRVAGSVADSVIVNGAATVYEIKTELDTPARLMKQITDYQKAFQRVVVVTHHSLAEKYRVILTGSPVGITALSPRGNLSTVVPPKPETALLNVESMLKSLRKAEYTSIVREAYGSVPDVPNTQHFSECLRRSLLIDPVQYAEMFEARLRARRLQPELSNKALRSIRHLCFQINPGPETLGNMYSWLNERLTTCTTPISVGSNLSYSQ